MYIFVKARKQTPKCCARPGVASKVLAGGPKLYSLQLYSMAVLLLLPLLLHARTCTSL